MKKIRLLAILLAMLMIPFSMFIACDEDPDDEDPVDDEEPGDDDDEESTPTAPIVMDDDGSNPDGGYLMYFHFNAAGDGMLNIIKPSSDTTKPESQYVLEAPYSTYLEGSSVTGGSYVVRTSGTRSFLAIERINASTSPTLTVKVGEALSSDIDADHMIRFDLYFEKGYFGSPVDLYGGKNSSKSKFTFLTIEDGALKDASGSVIYGDKADDKTGWIDVAIVVSEQTRKYDIYVDGIKQTSSVDIPASYPTWNEYKPDAYSLAIRNVGNANTYCFVDNLCMKNGNENTLGIYKGEDVPENFVAKLPTYYDEVAISRDEVLGRYGENASIKKTLFGSALSMANSLTLSKITVPDEGAYEIKDLMFDYGAEMGYYNHLSYLANENEYFSTWIESITEGENYLDHSVETIGKIAYDADKTDDVPAVEGTYTVANNIITFNWGEATAPVIGGTAATYAKYDEEAKALTVYSDAACTTAVDGAVYTLYTAAEAYADVEYSTVNVEDKVTLKVDPFFMTAKLSVGDVDGVYPYTVSENVITVTVGAEESYSFTYNDEENVFVYGTDVKLYKVVKDIELGEDDRLAIKWTNFKSNAASARTVNITGFDREWWLNNYNECGTFVFEFFATEEFVESGFRFKLIFNAPGEADGSNYFQADFDSDFETNGTTQFKYVEGWNRFEINVSTMGQRTKGALVTDITGGYITSAGWSNGPNGDNDGDVDLNGNGKVDNNEKSTEIPNDGYTLYIGRMAFVKNIEVELEGPAEDKVNCTHESDLGESLFEDVETPIAGNCVHGSYYIQRCSECGMTRINEKMPIGAPVEHNLGVEVKYVAPTCTEEGYYYKECLDCGYQSVTDKVAEKGHNFNINADWNNRVVTYLCVVCGEQREEHIYDTLIPMSEKIATKKPTVHFNVMDASSVTTTTDVTGEGNLVVNGLNATGLKGYLRCATITGVTAGGRPAVEITHLGYQGKNKEGKDISQHCYWSVPLTKNTNYNFVFEIDVMLGKKQADGTYISQSLQVCANKEDGARQDITLLNVDNDGVAKLASVSGTTDTVQLSDSKFTNLVFVYSSEKNTFALYADGYFVSEAPFSSGSYPNGAGSAQLYEIRWNMESDGEINGKPTLKDASTYFSGLAYYEGDDPICVITDIPVNEEATGDIVLKDEIGNPMVDQFNVNRIDVNSYLDVDIFTTKYVLEFTLNGADLADGTILQGVKRATGYNRYESLISVKDGKVYCVDKLISNTTENIKISLEVDDTIGSITVYLNGVKVDGTVSYSNDGYADYTAYLRGITFMNDCGEYTVSGLKMYTGAYVA